MELLWHSCLGLLLSLPCGQWPGQGVSLDLTRAASRLERLNCFGAKMKICSLAASPAEVAISGASLSSRPSWDSSLQTANQKVIGRSWKRETKRVLNSTNNLTYLPPTTSRKHTVFKSWVDGEVVLHVSEDMGKLESRWYKPVRNLKNVLPIHFRSFRKGGSLTPSIMLRCPSTNLCPLPDPKAVHKWMLVNKASSKRIYLLGFLTTYT